MSCTQELCICQEENCPFNKVGLESKSPMIGMPESIPFDPMTAYKRTKGATL